MAKLKLTAKGQVTLRKEVLKHLGVKAGDEIEFEVIPGGKIEMQAARLPGNWDRFMGSLAGKTNKVATLEEIKEATERAWAGQR